MGWNHQLDSLLVPESTPWKTNVAGPPKNNALESMSFRQSNDDSGPISGVQPLVFRFFVVREMLAGDEVMDLYWSNGILFLQQKPAGGFIFLIFTPKMGEDWNNFDSYFSDGSVKTANLEKLESQRCSEADCEGSMGKEMPTLWYM